MPRVKANGINIYYEVQGTKGAPPLVLSAGLSRDCSMWRDVVADLSYHFQVYIYDN